MRLLIGLYKKVFSIFTDIMPATKANTIKLLVIVLIFFCINVGSSGFLLNLWDYYNTDREHFNDVEIPHHTHNLYLFDIDNWFESTVFNLAYMSQNHFIYFNSEGANLKEYYVVIWQPPEIG